MKTKIYIKVLCLILIPVIYFMITAGINGNESFLSTSKSLTDNPPAKDFINLIFTDTYFGRTNPNDPRAIENNIKNFKDSLHFNAIHVYGYDSSGGGFNSDISWYSGYVSGLMDTVRNNGLKGYYGRNKIERLCYGQRLEYEAEGGNNGFSYQTINGPITTDSERTVVHGCLSQQNCPEADATPRYLCRNIYENLQHGDLIDFTQLDDSTWFIKPVMRIDSNIVDSNPEDSVVRIDIINYKGRVIKSVKINARDFATKIAGNYIYSGNYINIFDFSEEPIGTNLLVKGRSFDSLAGLNYGMRSDPWNKWKDSCKVDFKVWWYGKVEVWFDKMVVDDYWGNELFSGIDDYKIIEEVNAFTDNIGSGSFFIDELTHSQIPCVKRVYEVMKQTNSNAKLNFAVTNYFNIRSYKDNSIGNRELLKELSTESFSADAHEIQDILPVTLNTAFTDPLINPSWFYSKENYTLYLQKKVFGDKSNETGISSEDSNWTIDTPSPWGSLVYQIEFARHQRDMNSPFKKFIMQPQIHGVLRIDSTGYYAGGIREPLNEEIEAQAMLSIAHGAEGICWFIYYGQPVSFRPNPIRKDTFNIFGLLNPYSPFEHRHQNQYGQDKWKAVSDMNIKIEHWKPTLDKITWQNGFSVHNETADHNYISDIKSIRRNPSLEYDDDYPFTYYDATNERYWEIGFFTPDDVADKGKYFIMVNRRCVPDVNNDGDFRGLRIKFDSTDLTGFVNWKIIELDTNNVVATFNKNTTSYISMGEFKPGEGKLYKLSPIMQEGGTLVADESVSGVEFICKGEVLNNGKNITIGNGTNISFHTGAGIKMTYGNFICDGSLGSENINLKGYNGQSWNGINLTNTLSSTKIEKTTIENTRSPLVIYNSQFSAQYAQKIIRRNIFKVSQDSGTALRINNQFALSIDSNTFDVSNYNSTSGIYFSNYTDPGAAGAVPEDYYNVNITNNTFSGAYFPVMINNLGTAYSSFYMYNNQFINTGLFGISGMKITGTIKNNRFINPAENYNIYLSLSTPDIYGNFFSSDKRNMILKSSYPNIAPIRNSNNQLIWKGGRNGFYINPTSDTTEKENIYFRSSLPLTDLGENDFSIPDTNSYHIFGNNSEENSRIYLTRKNCWAGYNDIPKIFIYNSNDTPVTQTGYTYTPAFCITTDNVSNDVTDIGFGIKDTTYIGVYDSTDILPDDEALYSAAEEMLSDGNNSEAITNFKSLIDEFPTSDFIYSSEYYLYDGYYGLDTSSDQSVTDVLFGDLKQYLQAKISSGNYDNDFEDNAYYLILMCDNRMENYNNALTGYEFISLYHPDADRRIQATWEYENIENLMNGMGGGEKDFGSQIVDFRLNSQSFENEMERRLTRINEFADNDPATAKIRQNYLKAYNEKKINKEQRKNKTANIQSINNANKRSIENDEKLFERAKQNLYLSKRSSKEEKERRRFEDLKLILNPDNVELESKETDELIPIQYFLSQNYPNPFNPVTKISFELPNDAKVKLVVYDLLGREVKSIVNSQLTIGKYTFEFDGSNYATGVYFYKLVAGDFTAVKRMVLVK